MYESYSFNEIGIKNEGEENESLTGCNYTAIGMKDLYANVESVYVPIRIKASGDCEDTCEMPYDGSNKFIKYSKAVEKNNTWIHTGLITSEEESSPFPEVYAPSELVLQENTKYKWTKTITQTIHNPQRIQDSLPLEVNTIIETGKFWIPLGGYDLTSDDGLSKAYKCKMLTGDNQYSETLPLTTYVSLSV
jgi:hypothetical protein